VSLNAILNEALDSVPGAKFAGVIGTDGLSIELVFDSGDDSIDVGLAELELAALASTANATAQRLGSGRLLDMVIEAEALTFFASAVASSYFAVLAVPPDGSYGDARAAVNQIIRRIREEL
jgi:predicted regulator of Ras-like GTPase activity (Roadblock/LC7/MglB family)